MTTKLHHLWIGCTLMLIALFGISSQMALAQEEAITVTKHFSIARSIQETEIVAAGQTECEVTVELAWSRTKRVTVIYFWQGCSSNDVIRWLFTSPAIDHSSEGQLSLSAEGKKKVYDQRLSTLSDNDLLMLQTWINGVEQYSIKTTYRDKPPVVPKVDTRQDFIAGACFEFTGRNDPWGVFTAGDISYTFHLNEKEWKTPWLKAPNTPTVDWNIKFFQDAGLTRLRAEYDFTNLENPCYKPLQPQCIVVNKVDPLGDATIPADGRNVTVQITGERANFYRIRDISQPSSTAVMSFWAKPTIPYVAEVAANEDGPWYSSSACVVAYDPSPVQPQCDGLDLSIPNGSSIPQEGQDVQVTIKGSGTAYRIVDTKGTPETADDVIVVDGSSSNVLTLHAMPNTTYQGQVGDGKGTWTNQGCQFQYKYKTEPIVLCLGVTKIQPATNEALPYAGYPAHVRVVAQNASYFVIEQAAVTSAATTPFDPNTSQDQIFSAFTEVTYVAKVSNDGIHWYTSPACKFSYERPPEQPRCLALNATPVSGSTIPAEGKEVTVEIIAKNANWYKIESPFGDKFEASPTQNHLQFYAKPYVPYMAMVSDNGKQWYTDVNCAIEYQAPPVEPEPKCERLERSPADVTVSTPEVSMTVTCYAKNATHFRILDEAGNIIVDETTDHVMHFTATRGVIYHVEVRNESYPWQRSSDCQFQLRYAQESFCTLQANHRGDPEGLATITAMIRDENSQIGLVVPLDHIVIDWNGKGRVSYSEAVNDLPWTTNQPLEFHSRPDVHDIGFGRYHIRGWVYVQGFTQPLFCEDIGNAPDHDNVVPDPGPFVQDNPEGKFNRGDTPSRLPTVARLPFDGGNGPDKIELILWAFEKEGRGTNARITAVANEGKPLLRLGMASIRDYAKFDGLPAREGIVYGFQIGEHGPWGPLFCPKADSNPTTITVFWGAGGQTWLSDGAAYGDCWWLTVAAARQGWVTVEEQVATYNALQPIIDWNGHRNLVFSMAQDRTTGQGPRMQDMVIGLQAEEWQGPVLPALLPNDFDATVAAYRMK